MSLLSLTPEAWSSYMAAIAGTCAAIIGVGTILGFLWMRLRKGSEGFQAWIHKVAGNEAVRAEVAGVRSDLKKAIENTDAQIAGLAASQTTMHAENKSVQERHEHEISALADGVGRQANAMKSFIDEHLIDAGNRDDAIAAIARQANATAALLEQHTRARSRHLPKTRRPSTA